MENGLRRTCTDKQKDRLSRDHAVVKNAERLVIAGVGAFPECRRKLDSSGLLEALSDAIGDRRPLLGVCVGMQIMANEGFEFARTPGLGLVPGIVRRLNPTVSGAPQTSKLPHVGWTPIQNPCGPLFEGTKAGTHLYFVHSFVFEAEDPAHVIATADYGESFSAAISKESVFGCQFHPERSGPDGLRILENFCRWAP